MAMNPFDDISVVRSFLDELERLAGPPPRFNMKDSPEMQHLSWVKWSGAKDLLEAARHAFDPPQQSDDLEQL